MKKLLFILCFFSICSLQSQEIDLYCIAGDTSSVVVSVQSTMADKNIFSGSIVFDNPTVAYLDSIHINNESINIQRVKPDSILIPEHELSPALSYNIQFFFKALAGNDTITDIHLVNFELNDEPISDSLIRFHNLPIGGSVPYLKFAELNNCYPNPVTPYTGAHFRYFIDRSSKIRFTLVDPIGQQRIVQTIAKQSVGEHLLYITIDHTYSTGAYYLIMDTDTGSAKRKFWVIR